MKFNQYSFLTGILCFLIIFGFYGYTPIVRAELKEITPTDKMINQIKESQPKDRGALSEELSGLLDSIPQRLHHLVTIKVTITAKNNDVKSLVQALKKISGVKVIQRLPAGVEASVVLSALLEVSTNPAVESVTFPVSAEPMKEPPAVKSEKIITIGPAGLKPMQSLYRTLQDDHESKYITTDFVILCVQSLLSDAQLSIESGSLLPEMHTWLNDALAIALKIPTESRTEFRDQLWKNASAMLAVPLTLLDGKLPDGLTPEIEKLVNDEVALIKNAQEQTVSPIRKILEDYTQYRIRGLYEEHPELQPYFLASLWLSRADLV
ncbi:MAG: hypothetical protein A2161_12020 [Candidatus Schekmanbacteria bacterium RBG_13_48_7]|uniref:Uncharacterized protein n=1 Tax=Candidatus Schekmanbacteria bacterium RBG_13_48_7 TaxID=1817878 RepID=A0A1F7RMK8_9BACT|nr:MAG: hypothetical protein A2161_12020 [Candidatus Schekmanbacteria bacterium RBG_13_48_7]